MSSLIRASVLALVVSVGAFAADVRVLTPSGVSVDGVGIAAIDGLTGGPDGSIVFRAATTSLAVGAVTLASGDPLPAPLRGTIETITYGVASGDRVAVVATTNGSDVASVVLVVQGTAVTAVATTPSAERAVIVRVAMNARGDVAYQTGAGFMIVVPQATGQATVVAGPERNLRKGTSLVMDASGAVAWIDRKRDVWHWDAAHGLRAVGSRARRKLRLTESAVALDATRGLVYADGDRVFGWDPATGSETLLLARDSPPGDLNFIGSLGSVGFTPDGIAVRTIVKRASTGDVRWRYVCIAATVVVPCEDAGSIDAGARVLASKSSALLAARKRKLSVVVRPGDVIPGAGTIHTVEAHVVDGSSIVFAARTSDDAVAIARWRDGVVTDIPAARNGQLLDADDGSVVFVPADGGAAIARVEPDGDVRTAGSVDATDSEPSAVLGGRRLVVHDDSTRDLLETRRGQLVPLLHAGDPGARRIASFDFLARAGSRIVLGGTTSEDRFGVWQVVGRRTRRLGSVDASIDQLAVGRRAAVGIGYEGDDEGIFVVAGGKPGLLVRVGDVTALGTITWFDSVGIAGRDAIFVARLTGDGARRALLATRIR